MFFKDISLLCFHYSSRLYKEGEVFFHFPLKEKGLYLWKLGKLRHPEALSKTGRSSTGWRKQCGWERELEFLRLEDVWRWVVLLNVYFLSNKYGGGLVLLPCSSWRMDRSLTEAIEQANGEGLNKRSPAPAFHRERRSNHVQMDTGLGQYALWWWTKFSS